MKTNHYQQKSPHYGIGHTRLKRILTLAGSVSGLRVVDAGCSRGYLGARLKHEGGYVIGLDVSNTAISEAKTHLDEAYVVDLESSWPFKDRSIDLVILAEILEHVFDPKAVLKEAHRILRPNGRIIITTPNFMTWTNRLRFLWGQFEYRDQGMFDIGHIRFFTYSYLKNVLNESGFLIEEEQHIIFPGKLTRILKYWPSMFAFQFIVKAKLK